MPLGRFFSGKMQTLARPSTNLPTDSCPGTAQNLGGCLKQRTTIRTAPRGRRRLGTCIAWGAVLLSLNAAATLYRFGAIPTVPVFGDEIVINDPAIALSRGQGLIAPSFTDSVAGIDKLYAHFPPVYIFLQAAVFRVLGVSGYSLRLLTAVFSITAVLVFLLIVYRLCGYGVIKETTGFFVSCLYALSAPVIIFHRISRMESLVELLSLLSLYCALRLALVPKGESGKHAPPERKSEIGLLLGASLFAGLALATHPEAINAILPTIFLVAFAERVKVAKKIGFCALLAVVPPAIWIATYRSHWWQALTQMGFIRREKSPDPSIVRFGLDLLKKAGSNRHELMVFSFFCLTLLVLAGVVAQIVRAIVAHNGRPSTSDEKLPVIEKALGVAVPITLLILIFFLPSGIARYQVIYPIYLLLAAVLSVPYGNQVAWRPYVTATAAVLIVGQIGACILYVVQNRTSSEGPQERYDFVLNCIPATEKVAASPQLWFAFETRDRPFTVLYPGLGGLETWRKTSANPFDRFDVVLLSDYSKDDLDLYVPLATSGKVEQDVPIGKRVLRVYSRAGTFAKCGDDRLKH
jgi:4-amino-4-deoxy-L-arabinose transferase-like glycosyltransferase